MRYVTMCRGTETKYTQQFGLRTEDGFNLRTLSVAYTLDYSVCGSW
jgi:hypothetical protein